MQYLYIVLLSFLISSCANYGATTASDPVNRYRTQYESSMIKGELSKSKYYTGLYDVLSKSTYPDKGIQMKLLVTFIDLSRKLEAGEIDKEQFEFERMKHVAEFEIERAAFFNSQPVVQPQPYIYIPTDYSNGTSRNNRIRCTTNSIGNTTYTNCD